MEFSDGNLPLCKTRSMISQCKLQNTILRNCRLCNVPVLIRMNSNFAQRYHTKIAEVKIQKAPAVDAFSANL